MAKQISNQVEEVIRHIKALLSAGKIEPGDRLPAERRLSEQLGVSRSHVREAFQKLEAYGIVKTYPQSGTVVAQKKMQLLESLITDVLTIDQYDFASLVHVRVLLECEAACLCAKNRTEEDLSCIEEALVACEANFKTPQKVEKDFEFHHAVAVGSHNPVIASMLLIITPDVLKYYQRFKICVVPQENVFQEHRELLNAIRERDGERTKSILLRHFSNLLEFSQEVPGEFNFKGN